MGKIFYLPYKEVISLDDFPNTPITVSPIISISQLLLVISHDSKFDSNLIAKKFSKMYLEKYPCLAFNCYRISHGKEQKEIQVCFSFREIEDLSDMIEHLTKSILELYHTKDFEIKHLEFKKNPDNVSSGYLNIKLDIGYDDTEDLSIYMHSKFLKERIAENIKLDIFLELT